MSGSSIESGSKSSTATRNGTEAGLAGLLNRNATVGTPVKKQMYPHTARNQRRLTGFESRRHATRSSTIICTSTPAAEALLAASGPATPSIAPRPNSSGFELSFFSM